MKGNRKKVWIVFFERYGRLIIVAVVVCFVLLLFTPMKNKIGDNINGFVGNFANQTNKSLNEVRMPDELGAGDILEIEGKKYIVMSKKAKDTYLVISGENIGNTQFQPNQDSNGNYYDVGKYNENDLQDKRYDGQNSNVYEDSYIDKYLENNWYRQLPEKLQKAIQTTDIKQTSYRNFTSNPKWRQFDSNGGSNNNWYYNEGTTENPKWVRYDKANIPDDAQGAFPFNCWKQNEKGYNNTTYNTISRHVFLPSVEEVSNLVDLNNANKVYNFLKGTNNSLHHMWFRNSNSRSPRNALRLYYNYRSLDDHYVTSNWIGVRSAFVVDLKKVDYKVVDTVNYK